MNYRVIIIWYVHTFKIIKNSLYVIKK
jgi:hypothetical protein